MTFLGWDFSRDVRKMPWGNWPEWMSIAPCMITSIYGSQLLFRLPWLTHTHTHTHTAFEWLYMVSSASRAKKASQKQSSWEPINTEFNCWSAYRHPHTPHHTNSQFSQLCQVNLIMAISRVVVSVSTCTNVSTRTNVSSRSRLEKNCQRLGLGHLHLVPETNFQPNYAGHSTQCERALDVVSLCCSYYCSSY